MFTTGRFTINQVSPQVRVSRLTLTLKSYLSGIIEVKSTQQHNNKENFSKYEDMLICFPGSS